MKLLKIAFMCFLFTIIFLSGCSQRIAERRETIDYSKEVKALEKRYQSKVWTERRAAVIKAYEYPSKEALEFFYKASFDEYALIKVDAILGLSIYKSPKAYLRIKEVAIDTNESELVTIAALKGLSNYKSPDAVYVFIKYVDHEDPAVREAAIVGLIKIEDPAVETLSVNYIVNALNDENTTVKMAVLDNIHVQDKKIYNYLKNYLMKEDNHNNNTYLLKVLKLLQGYEIDEELEQVLLKLITHNNLEVRLYSLRALKAQPSMQ